MTQQPFSRPGAIDLSGLKAPAPQSGSAAPGGAAAAGGSSYAVQVSEESFQSVIETSMTAPVLLVFYSPTRMPESQQLADDFVTLSTEFEGRFLVGLVDIDAAPGIAQAMQIPSVPLVVAVLDGRPAPLIQDVLPIDELRTALTQVMQQLTAQGMTGRHQPRSAPVDTDGDGEPDVDPRYAAAQDALGDGDIDRAVEEYQKLVTANPADVEAAADLDMLGGHVEDAFVRLIELVRRTAGDERNKVREHLLGLFGAVGNDDPRVLKGRQGLASALF